MREIRRQSRKEEVSLEEFRKRYRTSESKVFTDETIPMNLPENDAKKEASKSTQEKKTKALEKKLDKTIEKTDKFLASTEYNLENNLLLSKYSNKIGMRSASSFLCKPNRLDYNYLKGNPKKVLNYVIININEDGYFESNTPDFLKAMGLKDMALKRSLLRLKNRGFITVYATTGVPKRLILVNPSILEM